MDKSIEGRGGIFGKSGSVARNRGLSATPNILCYSRTSRWCLAGCDQLLPVRECEAWRQAGVETLDISA